MDFRQHRLRGMLLAGMMWGNSVSLLATEAPSAWDKISSATHSPFVIQERSPTTPAAGAQVTIVVAFTSDLHGWLSTDFLFPEDPYRGFLHIVPIIEQLRAAYPDLILLDAGDTLQGSPANFYFNYHSPSEEPLPIVKLMNRLKYDSVALGNHDLEPPPSILQKNLEKSDFPWLAANLIKEEEEDPLLPPYHILERAGVRIGILGLLTPGTAMWVNKTHLEGVEIEDMFASTQKWVPILKQKEQVDLLIGLFHSGQNHRYDQYASLNQGVPIANAAGMIADYEDRFDLIISGHTHRLYPKYQTSVLRKFRTPLINPGYWGGGVSVAKFFLKEEAGKWLIEQAEYDFIAASPVPSLKWQSLIQADLDQVRQYLEAPTGVRLYGIPTKEVFYQCGAALSHQAIMNDSKEAHLSLLPGRWRWRKIPQKELHQPLKRLHLFRWLPYDNFLVQTQLYGRQIQILLEPYKRQQQGLFVRTSSYLAPGGFQVNLIRKGDSAILQLQQMKQRMPLAELYPVWVTNYHWNGGSGMMAEALVHPSQKLKETRQTLRDLIFAYLQKPAALPSPCLSFLKIEHVSVKP